MDAIIEFVLNRYRPTVRKDGGDIKLQGFEDGVVEVLYKTGVNGECSTCVFTGEQLREFLLESLQAKLPTVKDVRVIEEALA